jgi:hypothetical protein
MDQQGIAFNVLWKNGFEEIEESVIRSLYTCKNFSSTCILHT